MEIVERPFSEFLRHPNAVVADLAEHDVLLRRRNAPALRLIRADHHSDRTQTFESTARLLRNIAAHNPAALHEALLDSFAWAKFLPSDARDRFARELTETLLAAATVDVFLPVTQLVREWKATAEIHADPGLLGQLTRPVQATGDAVPRPPG